MHRGNEKNMGQGEAGNASPWERGEGSMNN